MRQIRSAFLVFALLFAALPTVYSQQAAPKAGPVFANGEAQVVEAFKDPDSWIRQDLWVETEFDSDGDGRKDRMHVSVTRPRQTETEGLKLPVVYETSPYYAGTAGFVPGLFWNIRHNLGEPAPEPRVHPEVTRRGERPIISKSQEADWIPRGYIVVHSSSPGTGLSDGSPTVGGDNESLAPKAVIEWLAGKDNGYTTRTGSEKVMATWSTGKVGMTGTSYNGTLPVAAATTGVKGLEAIIPIAPNTSYYHYYRSYGLVRNPGGYPGEDVDVLYDFIHSGEESKRARNNEVVRDKELVAKMDRITGDYNEFWAGRDYLNDMKPFRAALLMSHGFNDWNVMPEHSYRIYKKAKEMGLPVQIFYHQGGHGGPPPMTLMNRWFTRYLHGVQNGVENDPKSWIVREDKEASDPTAYPDYPHPDAADVTFHLSKGAPSSGGLSANAPAKQGTETFVDNFSFDGEALARAEYTNHRLIYLTPVLKQPMHISGVAKLKIRLASSKPAANLSVWVVSLPWNTGRRAKITDNIITRGWADPQNYRSLTDGEPLVPGRFYEMTFELQPDDQVIAAGQQIGLMIFSSDKDFTLHPDPGTELTIDLDGTKLTLPVVGGAAAFSRAMAN
ncbi:MAG: Xaa-Pro dipeptidyl-peptidase [Acidobacteriota bacterium]|nr:MAG: Xaa-Pro dipeptidyl-peptidase [Acidobacteriota bacterium]